MANSNIPVTPGVGANLQTYLNTIGGTPVQSEAVTLTNSAGVEEGTIANPVVVSGTVAVSALPSPFPVEATAEIALPTAATPGTPVPEIADKFGRLVVLPQAMRDIVGSQTTPVTTTAETTIVTAISGVFVDITGFQITNQSATPVTVTIKDSTAGTTRKIFDLVGNGGIVVHFSPPLPQATANNNWTVTLSAGSITVDVNVDYVRNQ